MEQLVGDGPVVWYTTRDLLNHPADVLGASAR